MNTILPVPDSEDLNQNRLPRKVLAISVRNAHKSYQKGCLILNNLSMSVPTGCIYSLLGSSGCGKSTLLSCCIGLGKLDKGEISMFGFKPGTKESGVPGQRVGYMPQELALYTELTIMEAFSFYGRVFGMSREQVRNAIKFFIEMLDLPKSPNRKVGDLSGGQKRRVSLAIALIHGPELLVLDEPTVGVDPLLRECIWKYLVKLVETQGTTVIITTHYIEEAKQSNLIGIMRNGRLLEEDSPQVLLQEYGMNSLEDIVLAISRLDAKNDELEDGDDNSDSLSEVMGDKNAIIVRYMRAVRSVEKKDIFIVEEELAKPIALGDEPRDAEKAAFWNKTTALLIKNFTVLLRNIGFLIFLFGLPGSQMILISLAIGADPKDILVGVVNGEYCDYESDSWRNYQLKNCPLTKVGENGSLSCYLLATLPSENFIYERSPSIEHALQRVQTGYTYGYIHFPVDYTLNVECKVGGGHGKCGHWDYVKPGSKITFSLDMTSKGVSANLKRLYLEGYLDSMKYLKNICRRNLIAGLLSEYSGDLPFEFGPPIYGKDDMSFNDFLAPSLLLALLFFFPLCSSAVTYIGEKRSGTLDRAIVAGIGTFEFIAGYFLIQVGIMLVQALISFLILIYVFDMQIVGSLGLALVISLLVGVSGMVLGFFVGVLCKDEFQAVMLAMGTFFPNIILAGICWPAESMIKALQRLSMFLPCTLAGESIRSILNRGWTFSHKKVWPGFLSTFAWILVYCFLTILVFRMKHRI